MDARENPAAVPAIVGEVPGMPDFFSPHRLEHPLRQCRYCRYFGGQVSGGAWCALAEIVQAQPQFGCSFFEREVGADDEPADGAERAS